MPRSKADEDEQNRYQNRRKRPEGHIFVLFSQPGIISFFAKKPKAPFYQNNRGTMVILVAEDDMGHFVLVKKNLWRSCVESEVIHFTDGGQILDFLYGRGEGAVRDPNESYVILLDIRMPKVDGFGVLETVKSDPELKKIPVIMLTTTDNPEEVERCYGKGCNFYLVKPSNYNDFMKCVEVLGSFLSLEAIKIPSAGRTQQQGI